MSSRNLLYFSNVRLSHLVMNFLVIHTDLLMGIDSLAYAPLSALLCFALLIYFFVFISLYREKL